MYLSSGSDPLAVSKHGQLIGFYIHIEAGREQTVPCTRAARLVGRSDPRWHGELTGRRAVRGPSTCVGHSQVIVVNVSVGRRAVG
jgi:hypothetical protein